MFGIRKSLLLIIFLCLGSALFADDYVVSLADLKVKSILTGYYVERVINATKEESCIGFVQRGMFNRQKPAVMQPSTAAEVENCLKRSFPQSQALKPLIIRINHLYIYELTWSSREVACIDMSVSFIIKDSTGYTELFTAGDSFERSGLDVTGFHPDNIVESLGSCFDDLSWAAEFGKLRLHVIPEAELYQNPLDHPEKYDIFQKKAIGKGLFKTFYAFRDCHPDTATTFAVNYHIPKKDTARVRASLELPSKLPSKKYYGFSDGKNIFVWAGSGFARVSRDEKAISLRVDKGDVYEGASTGVYMAGLLGGAIGGLLAGLASEATAAAANGPGKCTIDFSSGRLIPVNLPDYLKTESSTILFLSKASSTDAGLTVIHDKDTLCTLKPGNYLKLSLPSRFRELTLVLTGKDCISREEKLNLRLFNTDIYLVRIKKNREITIGTAFEQVRKDLLNGMIDENTLEIHDLSAHPRIN